MTDAEHPPIAPLSAPLGEKVKDPKKVAAGKAAAVARNKITEALRTELASSKAELARYKAELARLEAGLAAPSDDKDRDESASTGMSGGDTQCQSIAPLSAQLALIGLAIAALSAGMWYYRSLHKTRSVATRKAPSLSTTRSVRQTSADSDSVADVPSSATSRLTEGSLKTPDIFEL